MTDDGSMSMEELAEKLAMRDTRPPEISDECWDALKSIRDGSLSATEFINDFDSELLDSVSNHREQCLLLAWEGEGHGHSGIKWIERWEGFYFFDSSDHDRHGPFVLIDTALELHYFDQEGVPNGELEFNDEVPKKRASEIAFAMCGSEGGQVVVNGVRFVRKGTGIVESPLSE